MKARHVDALTSAAKFLCALFFALSLLLVVALGDGTP